MKYLNNALAAPTPMGLAPTSSISCENMITDALKGLSGKTSSAGPEAPEKIYNQYSPDVLKADVKKTYADAGWLAQRQFKTGVINSSGIFNVLQVNGRIPDDLSRALAHNSKGLRAFVQKHLAATQALGKQIDEVMGSVNSLRGREKIQALKSVEKELREIIKGYPINIEQPDGLFGDPEIQHPATILHEGDVASSMMNSPKSLSALTAQEAVSQAKLIIAMIDEVGQLFKSIIAMNKIFEPYFEDKYFTASELRIAKEEGVDLRSYVAIRLGYLSHWAKLGSSSICAELSLSLARAAMGLERWIRRSIVGGVAQESIALEGVVETVAAKYRQLKEKITGTSGEKLKELQRREAVIAELGKKLRELRSGISQAKYEQSTGKRTGHVLRQMGFQGETAAELLKEIKQQKRDVDTKINLALMAHKRGDKEMPEVKFTLEKSTGDKIDADKDVTFTKTELLQLIDVAIDYTRSCEKLISAVSKAPGAKESVAMEKMVFVDEVIDAFAALIRFAVQVVIYLAVWTLFFVAIVNLTVNPIVSLLAIGAMSLIHVIDQKIRS